jgi:hypothetical protein
MPSGFNLYRGLGSGGPYTLQNATPLPINTFIWVDATALTGTPYYYVATSVDSAGNESSYSAEVSGEINSAPPPPVLQPPLIVGNTPASIMPLTVTVPKTCDYGCLFTLPNGSLGTYYEFKNATANPNLNPPSMFGTLVAPRWMNGDVAR